MKLTLQTVVFWVLTMCLGSTLPRLPVWNDRAYIASAVLAVHLSTGAVSMMDAYRLAKPVALKWDERATLHQMNSVDTSGNHDPKQGADGRRTVWNVGFVVPGTERHLTVIVSRGKLVHPPEFRNPTQWSGYADLPQIPMEKIMQTVRARGLQPGTSVGFGYHFDLMYMDGRPRVRVYGQTQGGRRTVLDFDPQTGEVLDGDR